MAGKPDYANMKVGGEEYMQLVENTKLEQMRERAEKKRAFLAARAASSSAPNATINNVPLRDNRIERVNAGRDQTTLALTPEPEGQARAAGPTAQHGALNSASLRNSRVESLTASRDPTSLFLTPEPEARVPAKRASPDAEMIDAPSSPDEPLAIRRKMSESSRRSTLHEEESIKTEKTSASASSSRRPSGAAVAPMGPMVTERPSKAYAATQVTDRKAPPRQGTKVPRSMMPNSLKRPSQTNAPDNSNKRRSPSNEVSSPTDRTSVNTSLPIPDWYRLIMPARREASTQSLVTFMGNIKSYIQKLDIAKRQGNTADIETALESIRNWIHTMEYQTVQGGLLKATKLLDPQNLPRLFHNLPEQTPLTFDIVADAKALYRKWARMDFNADVLRGVHLKTKALDDTYTTRVDFHFYGTGDLISGQWWPLRICTLRDGAHGASQGGISGDSDGAYSIVVAGQYDDDDQGETLEYCGTPDLTKSGNMTLNTWYLRDSFRTKQPVRVLRSGNNIPSKSSGGSNDKKNVYLPTSGYRYDGVYDVVEEKLLDAKEQLWTFKLKRQGNQDPIRYSGPYARPSMQDLQEWQKVKQYARHE